MEKNSQGEMSLVEHLSELRTCLIICVAALVVCVVGAFFIAQPVLEVLTEPVRSLEQEPGREQVIRILVGQDGTLKVQDPSVFTQPEALAHKRMEWIVPADSATGRSEQVFRFGEQQDQQIYYHSPLDPFMMLLQVSLIVGVLLALPICLWQLWRFIVPGLTPAERRLVAPMLSGAIVLFPIGATFAFYIIKLVLRVMQSYEVEGFDYLPNVFDYLSLLTVMMLVFGVIFELPLAIAIAVRIGLVTPQMLTHYRRHAYVGLAFASMILTPADPFSMLAAFAPLVVLYEVSVLVARPMALMRKREQEKDALEEENQQA